MRDRSEPAEAKAANGLGRRGFLGAAAALTGTALTASSAYAAAPAAAQAASPAAAAADPTLPPNAVSLVPISKGAVTAAVVRLDKVVKDLIGRTGVPGVAVAVVHDGQVVFSRPYGVRDITTKAPVTVDTVFQLASVSKPLAATAVARGVHLEKLKWTDTIASHLPGFTLQDPYVGSHVTIEDMLAHRSGLPHAAGDLLEDLGYPRDVILERLRLESLTPMRTIYNYANFGYTSGGAAAARAAGMSWEDFADAMLFRPLGMATASYRYADFVSRPNRSAMHVRVDGVWQQRFTRNADPEAPAGGGSASVVDLTKWMMLQLAEGVWNGSPFIDPDVLRVMRTPAIVLSPPKPAIGRSSFSGQGLDISDDAAARVRWSHSGAFFQGAATQVLMLPSAGLGIVTLTNGMPVGLPEAIGASFLDLVEAFSIQRDWLAGYGGLFAASMTNTSKLAGKTPPANPTPAKPNAFYVGTYDNAYYGSIRVVDQGGSLHLLIGPHPNDYPLTHWDGNEFSFFPTGENALGITAADFTPNGAGTHAARVVLEYYDADGLGTFTLH